MKDDLKKYRVFVDFDGTVTEADVGYEFFRKFAEGRAEKIVLEYRRGRITAVECLRGECDIYNEYPAPFVEIKRFIEQQKLTPGFPEFVETCNRLDIPLTVLSAGFDFYIKPILHRHGLDRLPVLCNPTIIKNGRIYPQFIYYDPNTCLACANCKGARIRELLRAGESAVFIGDGHSDCHGALAADIVFAQSFLKDLLDAQKIPSYVYRDFHDVARALIEIVEKK